jgi:CDP-2,3-bis-(O-geranylgeranyl)-sn-glycerol synthase
MNFALIAKLLLLLVVANGTPVFVKKLLGNRWALPLDGGIVLADGRPLFGPSKTVRGVVLAVLAASGVAVLIGLGWKVGAVVGAVAMASDLLSSFLKRRMGMPSSSMAFGLDHIPESLFPLLACRLMLPLGWLDISLAVLAFLIGGLVLSPLLYKLNFRDRPY